MLRIPFNYSKSQITSRLYTRKEDLLSKMYSRYNDLLQHLQYSPFVIVCDLVIWWCVLHTPDLTPPDMTGCTLDSTAGAWPYKVKFTLPRNLLTHLGFPSVRVVLNVTFIPVFVMIMDLLYLINGFLSLYWIQIAKNDHRWNIWLCEIFFD